MVNGGSYGLTPTAGYALGLYPFPQLFKFFFIHILLQNVPREILSPEGFLTTLSILALNSQGIGTSAFALWVDQVTKDDPENLQEFLDNVYLLMEEGAYTQICLP